MTLKRHSRSDLEKRSNSESQISLIRIFGNKKVDAICLKGNNNPSNFQRWRDKYIRLLFAYIFDCLLSIIYNLTYNTQTETQVIYVHSKKKETGTFTFKPKRVLLMPFEK